MTFAVLRNFVMIYRRIYIYIQDIYIVIYAYRSMINKAKRDWRGFDSIKYEQKKITRFSHCIVKMNSF